MRYYLIDNENNNTVIDLSQSKIHRRDFIEFDFSTLEDNKVHIEQEKVYVRCLANKYFTSFDGTTWFKVAKQDLPRKILNVDHVYDLYRGFKPSGLSGAAEGDLITHMPGKVVKLLVKIGDEVTKGQNLLILEAMKMENEIKAAVDGVIKEIHIEEGQAVESGHLLIELETN